MRGDEGGYIPHLHASRTGGGNPNASRLLSGNPFGYAFGTPDGERQLPAVGKQGLQHWSHLLQRWLRTALAPHLPHLSLLFFVE